MGHYRSEMGYESEDAREATEKQKRHDRIADRIKEEIGRRGIEHVLADILEDPTMCKIHWM